jgi:hypothetical protein
VLPAAHRAEPPVGAARADGEVLGEGQQGVRLDGELPRGGLDVEPAPDAAHLGGERRAALAREVLDERVGVDEVEAGVGERQVAPGVGAHDLAGVPGPRLEVAARDVQAGLEALQPQRAAAHVEDAHARPHARQREEPLVAAGAGAPGQAGGEARPDASGGGRGVDIRHGRPD